MGTFRLTTTIDRPTTDVFAFVADPTNMPLWYEAVERVEEITPRAPGHAARYQITRSLPGGRASNVVEVTESEPNRVTFESREGPTPVLYRYVVAPDRGRSLLILDASISSVGLPGVAQLDTSRHRRRR